MSKGRTYLIDRLKVALCAESSAINEHMYCYAWVSDSTVMERRGNTHLQLVYSLQIIGLLTANCGWCWKLGNIIGPQTCWFLWWWLGRTGLKLRKVGNISSFTFLVLHWFLWVPMVKIAAENTAGYFLRQS